MLVRFLPVLLTILLNITFVLAYGLTQTLSCRGSGENLSVCGMSHHDGRGGGGAP